MLLAEGGQHGSFDDLKGAGADVTVSVLQNVYAEDIVHAGVARAPGPAAAQPGQRRQAVAAGRADAAAIDQSTVSWLVVQQPGQYKDAGYGWYPQSYGAAVKPGDPVWLNFVNALFEEPMVGVDFPAYAPSVQAVVRRGPRVATARFPGRVRLSETARGGDGARRSLVPLQLGRHLDTFCHRALCAKGLLNTGEALASVRDPQHWCHGHLMRSASAEGAHLEDGVLAAPKCPAACPLPSPSLGSFLSGKGM